MTVSLRFKVKAGSGTNRVVGLMADGQTIKLELNAPPERHTATRAIVAFIAEVLDLPARRIVIKHGRTSPLKVLSFDGFVDPAPLISRLTGK